MDKNLVMIIDGQEFYYDNEKDLVKKVICEDYYNMTEENKNKELEKKAIASTMLENINSVKLERKRENYQNDAFIIDDEITHILSLAKFNKIVLLEKSTYECFGKYLNSVEKRKNTYIIINKFVNEIMQNYLDCKYSKKREDIGER